MLRKLGATIVTVGIIVAALLAPFAGIEHSNRPPNLEAVLFFPSKESVGDWNPRGLRYKDIMFLSADGVELHGWLCEADRSRGAVLFIHGNAGNLATRAEWLHRLQSELHLDVFAFDYRGYGRSEGKPSVERLYLDVLAAHDVICEELSLRSNELIVMGESIGGAYAVWLASERRPRAMVLYSTFSSLHDMAVIHYPQYAAQIPADVLNSTDLIKGYKDPLLQIHGSSDSLVPTALARRLNAAYTGTNNQFFEHPNAGHDGLLSNRFVQQLDLFVSQLPELATDDSL